MLAGGEPEALLPAPQYDDWQVQALLIQVGQRGVPNTPYAVVFWLLHALHVAVTQQSEESQGGQASREFSDVDQCGF